MRALFIVAALWACAQATHVYVDCTHGVDAPGRGDTPGTALLTPMYARDLLRSMQPLTTAVIVEVGRSVRRVASVAAATCFLIRSR